MWFSVVIASPCKNSYDLPKSFQLTLLLFVKFLCTTKPIPTFFDFTYRSSRTVILELKIYHHACYLRIEEIGLSFRFFRDRIVYFLLRKAFLLWLTTVLYQVPLQLSTQRKCRRRSNEKVICRDSKITARILILHQTYSNNPCIYRIFKKISKT